MASESICDLLTWDALQAQLQRALNTSASFGADKKADPAGDNGGFVSQVIFLTFDWTGDDVDALPQKAVLKMATPKEIKAITETTCGSETGDEVIDVSTMINENELQAYEKREAWGLGSVPMPRLLCGSRSTPAFLLLEFVHNASSRYLYDDLDDESFRSMLRIAAKIHAAAVLHPEIADDFKLNVPATLGAQFVTAKGICSNFDKIKNASDSKTVNIEILKRFASIYDERKEIAAIKAANCGRPLLAHGDFTQANALWSAEGDVLALHDWQMCHIGNPLTDLARFFALGLPPNALTTKCNAYLEIYYDELKAECQQRQLPWQSQAHLVECFEKIFPIEMVSVTSLLIPFASMMLRTCPAESKAETLSKFEAKLDEVCQKCVGYIGKWYSDRIM